jgi:hypothetical protein
MATNKDFIVKSGLQVQSTASSTSTVSGALIVAGGAGIAGDLWVGGNIYLDGVGLDTVQGTTATFRNIFVTGTNVSTSTTTGAVTIAGGLGVAGNIYGTAIYDNGVRVLTSATVGNFGVSSITAGTDTAVSASTGAVTIWNTGTLQSVTNRGAATTNAISITNSTVSTGSTTGALLVTGGVGVGQNLNVAGQLTVAQNFGYNTLTNTIAYFGANTSSFAQINAQNIGGGTSSSVDFVATSNNGNDTTNFIDFGINNSSFTDAAFTIAGANDGYLYTQGGNLAIGAAAASRDIIYFQGGTLSANEVGRWANASGLVIKRTTDATSVDTGALQVDGGVGINKQLWVGGTANLQVTTATNVNITAAGASLTAVGATFTGQITNSNGTASSTTGTGAIIISNNGGLGVGGQVTAQLVKVISTTTAGSGSGALQVAGGAYIADNVYIASTAASTGTATANALYVAGGANIANSLVVQGTAIFGGNVVFNGTSTNVYSTNTVYTDNLINLHVPAGSTGTDHNWTLDDGKDIGFAFHYYKTVDKNAFLGLTNNTGYLEWFENGYESTTGVHTSGTYGTFKTGSIILTGNTNATTTATGALQVAGGIGVGRDVYVGGDVTIADTTDSTTSTNGALIVSGGAGIAKNLVVGSSATIQSLLANANGVAANALQVTSGGLGVGGSGYFGGAVKVASNTAATNTTSGGLQVVGGAGIGGALYVGGIIDTLDTTDAGLTTPGGSGSLQASGGAGIAKNLAVGGTISRTGAVSQAAWQNATGVALNLAAATYTDTSTGAGTVTGPSAASWLGQPTFASTNAVTYTEAATLYIQNAPAQGTNTTLTNPYSLLVANGVVKIKTTTASSGVTSGALVVDGGLGVAGNLYAGAVYDNGVRVLTSATIGNFGVSSISAGTDTAVSASTGAVTIWNTSTLQSITNRGATTTNAISITNNTAASNTTTGALKVSGGIGALQVYATNLFDSGNRVLTSITATAGTGLSGGGTISGPSGTIAFTNTGVLSLTGTTALGVSSSTGAITLTNLGVTSLTAGNVGIGVSSSTGTVTLTNMGVTSLTGTANQIAVSASTGSVTLSFPTGGITTTVGTFTSNVYITNADAAFSASTGALQVTGGVGVAKSVFVGTTATVAGTLFRNGAITATGWGSGGVGLVLSTSTYTDSSLNGAQPFAAVHSIGRPTIAATNSPTYADAATLYIDNAPAAGTNAVITNPWSLYVANGNVRIATTTVSNSSSAGALVVSGGVGIGGALNVGGSGSFAATGVSIGNTLISSYTSSVITTNATQNLDTFSTSTYRTARYTVQVVDGTKVHITEMTVFHDNTVVYKNEYGISTNTGELGAFDATLGSGTITLTFTPNYTPSAMTIKANRTAITS